MISVSSNYKTNATKPVRNINAKISIGAVDFGIDDIVSFELSRSPSDGGLSVGGTAAARLTATIRATKLPTMDDYKVTVFIGFTALAEIGTFFITDLTQEKGYVTIEAYDRFYYLDKPCSFNGSAGGKVNALSFPATHQEMLEYISKINGFSLSVTCEAFAKVKTKPIYNSEATNPTNKYYTYREIIGFIAACNGCNAQFDANDKLIFTRPSNSVETVDEGSCESCTVAQDGGFTVKGIRFTIGTDTAFYIDANGTVYDESLPGIIEAVNPLATVEIMEYVWNKLGGYHYYAANVSRRGRGWLLPDDVIEVMSNGTTKKATITAISYELSKDGGFSEQITSTAESTEQSSNRYSAAGDHISNAGAGKYNSTTIINDPVIISEKTKEYLKYDYSIIGYSVDDKITYGQDGKSDIIVQSYTAKPITAKFGAICGDFIVNNGIYNAFNTSAKKFVSLRTYITVNRYVNDGGSKYWYYFDVWSEINNGETVEKVKETPNELRSEYGTFTLAVKWGNIFAPTKQFPNGRARVLIGVNYFKEFIDDSHDAFYQVTQYMDVSFSSVAEYNAAIRLTRLPLEKKDVNQTVSKIVEAGGTADFPELGENDVLYIDSTDNSAYKWSSKISAYYCVGRDYFSIKQIQSTAEPNSSDTEILEAQLLQDMRSPSEWTIQSTFVPPKGYICITDFDNGQHGIKIGDGNTPWSELLYVNIYDLSEYLKNTDIADWAKAESKPAYTAEEVGAAAKSHTHTKSEITDFPTLGTAAGKNAVDFYPAKSASVLGGDYNDLNTTGIFELQGDAANPTSNTPNGNHKNNNFYVQVFVRNAKYLTQIATSVRADKTRYIRSLNNGIWNDWEKIKSGDADTVDGKHASDFATARHTHTATEVGAATAADITAAITDIEIGGRNLLYHSRFDKKYPTGWAYSEEVTYTFDDEVTTLTKAETASRHFTTQASVSNGVVVANPNLLPENGCTYTISCEVMKAEGYDVGNGTKITTRYNFTDGTVKDFDVDVSGASETAWTKYSSTYTYASDKTVSYTQFIIALGAKACGIRIKNVKFEKGNKPTDWTPAPEDDERRIASLEARVAALEAAAVSGGEV